MRHMVNDDRAVMFQLDSNPFVCEAIGCPPVASVDDVSERIKMLHVQYAETGIGRWAVVVRHTGDVVGWAGLKVEHNVNGHAEFFDLGYRFLPEHWGKGYATECSRALVAYGFDVVKADKVCAYCKSINHGSRRVAEKAGLSLVTTFPGERMDEFWLEITEAEYRGGVASGEARASAASAVAPTRSTTAASSP